MRALPICLVALMLSGCSMLSRSPVEPVQSTATPPKAEPEKPKAPRAAPVRIITNAEDLVGKTVPRSRRSQRRILPGIQPGFTAEHSNRTQTHAD
ncbi:outer membrane lipoprotein [Citrobacter braakii]|nr:outer membrane lipoprotein [Citrobacter braakii]